MQWVVFKLTMTDNVRYITSDQQRPSIMSYKRFMSFINSFKPLDSNEFTATVNKYKTIHLFTDTGEWSVRKVNWDDHDLSFENLAKLNPDKVDISNKLEDLKADNLDSPVDKTWKKIKTDLQKFFNKDGG